MCIICIPNHNHDMQNNGSYIVSPAAKCLYKYICILYIWFVCVCVGGGGRGYGGGGEWVISYRVMHIFDWRPPVHHSEHGRLSGYMI